MAIQTTVASAMPVGVAGQISHSALTQIDSLPNNSVQKETFTVTDADTTTTVTINGTAYTFTETTGSQTTTAIATAVAALINAAAGVSATSATNVITVVSDTPGTGFTSAATANCAKAIVNHNSAAIPFGYFVCIDSNNKNNVKLPAVATDVTTAGLCAGFTMLSHAVEQTDGGYAVGSVVEFCSRGRIRVVAEETLTRGDAVYVRHTSGTASTIGAIRNDNDSNTCALLAQAQVISYDSTTGTAVIEYNFPA